MFDRSLLKANAKVPLRTTYWTAFGVTTVYAIAYSIITGGGPSSNSNPTPPPATTYIPPSAGYDFLPEVTNSFSEVAILGPFVAMFAGLVIFLSILSMALNFFLLNPLEVGKDRFFVYNRRYPADFTTLFSSFKKDGYINSVKTLAARDVLVFLWMLLLVVPGIIAAYRYQALPYILAESPNMPPKRAFELSKSMTDGYKFELFALDVSFIGWLLLGILACGVGVLFVRPYIEATKTEAYEFMKQQALSKGLCDISEFN